MRIDTNLLGTVAMPDAGKTGPPTVERRYTARDYADAFDDFTAWALTAEQCGFDTLWYTEHHFQHEGYEVIPNQILLGTFSAAQTTRLRFGQMFNIVPQWNPLRLAEDFAAADLLTKGRMRFGVGRGTVPREMQTLGAQIESGDNHLDADAERINREMFEEALEIIRLAFGNESFSFSGKHYVYPPHGIPDRGTTVTELSLVPRPLRPVEIYQPCTSPKTVDYVAANGHIGVYVRRDLNGLLAAWEMHENCAAQHGRKLEAGAERMLVLHVHIADTMEEAIERFRPAHDELVKLLAPYGRYATYAPPPGMDTTPFDYAPELEVSMQQDICVVGPPDLVAERIDRIRQALQLRYLSLSLDGPGLDRASVNEQMQRFAGQVAPLLGIDMHAEQQRSR